VARAEVTGRRVGVPKKDKSTDAAKAIAAAAPSKQVDDGLRDFTTPPRLDKNHHLDQRAERLIEHGSDDDLLTTKAVANWLGVSDQWVELGRTKNYGPHFQTLATRIIRYRRGDVNEWLAQRSSRFNVSQFA
jgi:predicted DNA-binding transcriptional regulator AlpA